jgi:glucose/arabinose dehydrogenase
MKTRLARCGASAAAFLCLPSLLFAQIQIAPVASGLSSPVFVGHAGDGTNRLFILEQPGTIRVLQPGGTAATVFLNINAKVVSGGEQGLLGLAFHPQYISNGRFFVYYTRVGDGALVISEFKVSSNPNVAGTAEKILLTILHPSHTNHNGGMLAFGPDGYLYIGVGDGGSSNDPLNNAQDTGRLLGKVLRIDIDTPSGYRSPPSNPYVGVGGRDEIFARGVRNPWRFSFDRLTGQQWLGDVGQGAREEVNTPIVSGGNYGWRVYEGHSCSNIDPAMCTPANYRFPRFGYATHTGGRCAITGGYVYRGSQGTLPGGTYVYGDFCSGEIFRWDGSTQAVLLDTTMNISSFGEDEAGEIYVVNLGGTVGRITSTAPPCNYAISPTQAMFPGAGGNGSFTVTAGTGCGWAATDNKSWITITSGTGSGNGTVTYSVAPLPGLDGRNGAITVAGLTFTVRQTR